MGPGRKSLPGCEGGRSKAKYKCRGCSLTPRGTDLSKHYKNQTNWDLVRRLRASVGTAAVEQLREQADLHTLFIFEKGYTKEKLPTWSTHVMAKESSTAEAAADGEQGAGGSEQGAAAGGSGEQETTRSKKLQTTIGGFFQVRCLSESVHNQYLAVIMYNKTVFSYFRL